MKYFPNERNYFPKEDFKLLKISDNGLGKAVDEKAKGTGFGSQLVDLLTRQIELKLMQDISKGTLILINFKRQVVGSGQL